MRKILYFLFLSVFAANVVFAAPARKLTVMHKQSDGTQIYVQLNGDEAFHYYATLDNVPVVKGDNGDFYYALLADDGTLVASDLVAHNSGARNLQEQSLIDANDFSGMRGEIRSIARARAAKYTASRAATIAPKGEVNVPVLLVQYSDVKFKFTKEVVSDFLNKENYEGYANPIAMSPGSAKDYFIAQSDGQFRPNFVVTDIITLPNTMAYYGANDSSGEDVRPGHMIADALAAADAKMDFSVFDNDGDGKVEFVYCIYAGYGENVSGNSTSTIWPHQWELSSSVGTKTHDGVKINVYACSNELAVNEEFAETNGGHYLSGIGTMCHEFSHCLGLPDIYDTAGTGASTFDYWDIMDSGCYAAEGYVPVGYSAYARDFMGWKSLEVINERGDYSMASINKKEGKGYKIVNDANSKEYFILENRQKGVWDNYLFGTGMLISHIDYDATIWNNNTLNTNKNRLRYSLVPADNEIVEYTGSNGSAVSASYRGDVWPGTSGNTEFTDTSVPAAKVFTGGYLGKPVTNIKEENEVVYFSFMKGVIDTPAVLPATDVASNAFRANWGAVEYAAEYIVELEKVVDAGEGNGEAKVLLSENFAGCTKANETINNLDNYLSEPGWSGAKLYGEQGVIRVGTASTAGSLRTPKLNNNGKVTLSFSMKKYNTADTSAVLTISLVKSSGVATDIVSISATNDWVQKEVEIDATGDFYIEFSTKNSTGKKRVSVDNVVVSYKSSITTTLVESISTAELSYVFTGLEPETTYRYRVAADDGDAISEYSGYVTVTTAARQVVSGDVDGDGVVDVADVTAIVECILSEDVTLEQFDVNNDGAVDVADITKVVSVILSE